MEIILIYFEWEDAGCGWRLFCALGPVGGRMSAVAQQIRTESTEKEKPPKNRLKAAIRGFSRQKDARTGSMYRRLWDDHRWFCVHAGGHASPRRAGKSCIPYDAGTSLRAPTILLSCMYGAVNSGIAAPQLGTRYVQPPYGLFRRPVFP